MLIKLKNILLDLISFDSPQAKVFNFSFIILLSLIVPISKINYIPIFSVYQTFFNMTFYSAGMTHSMISLFHGDIQEALMYNKLVIIFVPVMLFLLIYNVKKSIEYYKKNKKIYKYF